MLTLSARKIIFKKILLHKDLNNNVDIPTVLLKLAQNQTVINKISTHSYATAISELEEIGEICYYDNLGNYRKELEYNLESLITSNQLTNKDELIKNHCRWIFGTIADINLFLNDFNIKNLDFPIVKFLNGDILERYKNNRGIILFSVYQNHIGFLLTELLKNDSISIISRGNYDINNYSSFLGCFQKKIDIIPATIESGKNIFYKLKNNKILGVYNDFLYPDSRGTKSLLFGKYVAVSETLLRLACLTKSVLIPVSIVKKENKGVKEIEVKFNEPIDTGECEAKDCFENTKYKLSLYTELLIRYSPEQWRLWNTLKVRWNQ